MKQLHTFFALSLLFLFVGSSFLLLSLQVQGYQSILKKNETIEEVHTPKAYLYNKMRFYDSVSFQRIGKMNVLVLENESHQTLLYQKDHYLYECTVNDLATFDSSLGSKLFLCDGLSFHKKGNQVQITYLVNHKKENITCRLRGEENA